MAASVMDGNQYRGTISALLSALIHAVVLVIVATTSIQIATKQNDIIPLVIREPAPPPPPPAAGAGPPAAVVVPAQPQFVDKPKPIESKPIVEEVKPQEKPKIAAKPKPTRVVAKPMPTPPAAVPPASAPADAVASGGDAGSGVTGGVIGGVAGGKVGGKIGGRLGGTGDDVWSADQVAVPPKVLETVPPQYPPMARARGQEGVVVVQAIIGRSGDVEPDNVRVIKSMPPFDEPAVIAFRRWKFKPGADDSGQNVRVLVQQPIRFQLR